MNRLPLYKRAQILKLLVEGNSIRAITRISDVSKNTVTKLLCGVGSACLNYQDEVLRNLTCKNIQCDEIWSFCYAKERSLPKEMRGQLGLGDVWTWTAIDADTKLCVCWHVGKRNADDAVIFMRDLASRIRNRVQLTTDGHKPYLKAVKNAFETEIDYGVLLKIYGPSPEAERRYSPPVCLGAEKTVISGSPKQEDISTSYVERGNLTMRMSMRRFTRLTNAFSKKIENLAHAISLHFMYYNFGRIHQTLRHTPAMAAGISNHIWEMEEIAQLEDSN